MLLGRLSNARVFVLDSHDLAVTYLEIYGLWLVQVAVSVKSQPVSLPFFI